MSRIKPKQSPAQILRHRNLPLLMLQARELVVGHFRPLLKTHRITEQQWRILRALLEHGPLEPRQISEICCLSSPSLAGVLARMDEVGLVSRERLSNDQRRLSVSLTTKSHALANSMAAEIEAIYAMIEDHVGKDKIEDFYQTLDELIRVLTDLSPPHQP
jgi:homoprotocatechuate degradation regulator HpaR